MFFIFIFSHLLSPLSLPMEKLLQWSIAQQSGDKEAMAKIGQPDPKMLEQLFGGPDEPALMKHAMTLISSDEALVENKEVAFENFEMLIENMDNANNIENLQLWPGLIAQLHSKVPDSLRVYAASCIAIAVQNNPKAQDDFLRHPEGLKQVLALAEDPSIDKELHLKCLSAISSVLRNHQQAYNKFDELNGWKILKFNKNADHKSTIRVLSIMSAVLSTGLDDKKTQHIQDENLISFIVSVMHKDGHIGCIDKALNIITQLSQLKYPFSATEISDLVQGLERVDDLRDQLTLDDLHAAKQVVS